MLAAWVTCRLISPIEAVSSCDAAHGLHVARGIGGRSCGVLRLLVGLLGGRGELCDVARMSPTRSSAPGASRRHGFRSRYMRLDRLLALRRLRGARC